MCTSYNNPGSLFRAGHPVNSSVVHPLGSLLWVTQFQGVDRTICKIETFWYIPIFVTYLKDYRSTDVYQLCIFRKAAYPSMLKEERRQNKGSHPRCWASSCNPRPAKCFCPFSHSACWSTRVKSAACRIRSQGADPALSELGYRPVHAFYWSLGFSDIDCNERCHFSTPWPGALQVACEPSWPTSMGCTNPPLFVRVITLCRAISQTYHGSACTAPRIGSHDALTPLLV